MKKDLKYLFFIFFLGLSVNTHSREIIVSDEASLGKALADMAPGDEIFIEPGIYQGGFSIKDKSGTREKSIKITGRYKEDPLFFSRGREAFKISSVEYLKIENLIIDDFSGNGINIDDKGKSARVSNHLVLKNILISNIGKNGNHDGLKLSGVDNFIVESLIIKGFGGSGIDMVGCHNGIIKKTMISGEIDSRTKNGIQIKGGSSNILVENCVFMNSGLRCINIGGSTGLQYFRPENADYEAKEIIVAGNKFIGGKSHIAWVTSRNTYVCNNIFYLPEKFVMRILQESSLGRFLPCQNGIFEKNLVVTDSRLKDFVNVGPHTKPHSFWFIGNAWYDFSSKKRPDLPVREKKGIYGVYPDLERFGTREMKISPKNRRLKGIGPKNYKPYEIKNEFLDIKIKLPDFKGMGLKKDYSKEALYSIGVSLFFLLNLSFFAVKRSLK